VSFKPVILPTDALIFLIIAAAFAAAWYIRRRPHLVLPWRRVARSSAAMVSLLVLSLFLVVGVLDSLHYRPALPDSGNGQTVYSPEVLSVFDTLAGGLRTRTEKTYSAPLAAQLYAMENMETPDGRVTRGFPRLKSGGAHLSDPERELAADVAKRGALGVAAGLAAGVLIAMIISSFPRKRESSLLNQPRAADLNTGFVRYAGGMFRWIPAFTRKGYAVVVRGSSLNNTRSAGMTGKGPLRAVLIATLILSACIGAIAALAPAYHVLGTDKVGQDVLFLVLKSIRTGLVIGTATTLVMLPLPCCWAWRRATCAAGWTM